MVLRIAGAITRSHAFKQDMNELKLSAHWVVDKMGKIEEQSDSLLEHSNQIYDSLNSIDSQAQVVIQKSQIVEDKITNVMDQSKAIFEQSYQIVDAQSKLREEQLHMQKTLDSSLADLQNSYVSLGEGIGFLQKITTETQNQITEVGDAMSSKLENLQTKADDIGNVVAMSLDQQKKLLDGQSLALQGLDNLTQFQAEAFEESRYRERIVWTDKDLNLKLLRKGLLTRIYAPMAIVQGLREAGVFSNALASGHAMLEKSMSKEQFLSSISNSTRNNSSVASTTKKVGVNKLKTKSLGKVGEGDSQAASRKLLEESNHFIAAVPPMAPPTLDVYSL